MPSETVKRRSRRSGLRMIGGNRNSEQRNGESDVGGPPRGGLRDLSCAEHGDTPNQVSVLGGTGLKNLCAEGIGNSEPALTLASDRDTRLVVNSVFPMLRTQLEASCATRGPASLQTRENRNDGASNCIR